MSSRRHGWWESGTDGDALLAKLTLIHSEVSEAVELVREKDFSAVSVWNVHGSDGNAKPEGFGIELADVVLRVFDMAEALGINIEDCMREKHAYNRTRPHKHGKRA